MQSAFGTSCSASVPNLNELDPYRRRDPSELLDDRRSLGHIKWLFVIAVEGCINATHHIGASDAVKFRGTCWSTATPTSTTAS